MVRIWDAATGRSRDAFEGPAAGLAARLLARRLDAGRRGREPLDHDLGGGFRRPSRPASPALAGGSTASRSRPTAAGWPSGGGETDVKADTAGRSDDLGRRASGPGLPASTAIPGLCWPWPSHPTAPRWPPAASTRPCGSGIGQPAGRGWCWEGFPAGPRRWRSPPMVACWHWGDAATRSSLCTTRRPGPRLAAWSAIAAWSATSCSLPTARAWRPSGADRAIKLWELPLTETLVLAPDQSFPDRTR